MMRQGSAVGAKLKLRDEPPSSMGGTPAERERKRREKLERDAWCRKERKYRDSSPHGRDYEEWIEGDKVRPSLALLPRSDPLILTLLLPRPLSFPPRPQVVTERGDGKITVRDMTPEEKRRKAKKHLDALRALGHPAEELEADLAKFERPSSRNSARGDERATGSKLAVHHEGDTPAETPARGRSPQGDYFSSQGRSASPEPIAAPRTVSPQPGLSLFRSERIDPPSDDDASPAPAPAAAAAAAPSAARPLPARQNSKAMQSMRELFRARGPSRSPGPSSPSSRTGSPERDNSGDSGAGGPSIRFAAVDRPQREGGGTGTGRALPVVGGPLSMRKVPSQRAGES